MLCLWQLIRCYLLTVCTAGNNMQIGGMDQRIILQSLNETNVQGSLRESWVTVATVWAMVISQRGAEAFEAARVNARETIRIKLRYRTDINAKWRIGWNGQQYGITNVDRSHRRKGELWLTAQAVGAE